MRVTSSHKFVWCDYAESACEYILVAKNNIPIILKKMKKIDLAVDLVFRSKLKLHIYHTYHTASSLPIVLTLALPEYVNIFISFVS